MLAEDVKKLEQENKRLEAENRELRNILGSDIPKPKKCGNCAHFIQHYISIGIDRYAATHSGHCTHGRTVTKKPDGKTCQYYELGSRKRF